MCTSGRDSHQSLRLRHGRPGVLTLSARLLPGTPRPLRPTLRRQTWALGAHGSRHCCRGTSGQPLLGTGAPAGRAYGPQALCLCFIFCDTRTLQRGCRRSPDKGRRLSEWEPFQHGDCSQWEEPAASCLSAEVEQSSTLPAASRATTPRTLRPRGSPGLPWSNCSLTAGLGAPSPHGLARSHRTWEMKCVSGQGPGPSRRRLVLRAVCKGFSAEEARPLASAIVNLAFGLMVLLSQYK